jgi:hypothetical protein
MRGLYIRVAMLISAVTVVLLIVREHSRNYAAYDDGASLGLPTPR